MKEACKLNPGVPSDKTVPSKLFNGLVKYFEGDMDNAAFAYAVIYNKSISNAKLSDIRKDENGEPLLEDVLDRIDFKSLLKGGLTKSKIEIYPSVLASIGASLGYINYIFNSTYEFPTGYSSSDPDTRYRLSLKSAFHWRI